MTGTLWTKSAILFIHEVSTTVCVNTVRSYDETP